MEIVFQIRSMTPKDMKLRIQNACRRISRAEIEPAVKDSDFASKMRKCYLIFLTFFYETIDIRVKNTFYWRKSHLWLRTFFDLRSTI